MLVREDQRKQRNRKSVNRAQSRKRQLKSQRHGRRYSLPFGY